MASLGERIRVLRKQRGWTLRDLGDAVGVSSTYLSMIELGDRVPTLDTLDKIARAFSVSPGLLQDPLIDVEKLPELSELIVSLNELKASQLDAIRHMISSLRASS